MPRPASATPFWLKWVVLAFIAYAVWLHFVRGNDTSVPASSGGATRAVDYTETGGDKVGSDIEGEGEPAACGQRAKIEVAGRFPNREPVPGSGETVDIAVGVPTKSYPWAASVSGMKVDGVRGVSLRAEEIYPEKSLAEHGLTRGDKINYKLELVSLSPSLPENTLPFSAADRRYGTGVVAGCSDRVSFQLDLWASDGSLAYSSRSGGGPLTTVIGNSEFFYGIDRALLGMREGGSRTAIIPPGYLMSAGNDASLAALDKLPRDRALIADLELIGIVEEETK